MTATEYDTIARVEASHWWYVGMRRIAREWIGALGLPRDALVLDAGCGTGGALRWLAEFGAPTGIDLHPLATLHARRHESSIARASVQTLPFADGAFDLVTSFDVLYHLAVSDDAAALTEMARVLRSPGAAPDAIVAPDAPPGPAPDHRGGWLLVRVPAHDWLRRAHDRHVQTRHRYGERELCAKLESAGFDVVRLTPVGLTLLPGAIVRWLTQRSGDPQSDVVLPPAPVNRVLEGMLAVEARWLRRRDLPLGLSLLALARRNRP